MQLKIILCSFFRLKIHHAYVDLIDAALIESNVKNTVLICFLSLTFSVLGMRWVCTTILCSEIHLEIYIF